MIRSPIYYMGNKYRLLNQLGSYIPEKINRFIDVFGGSGVMALNFSIRSNKAIYNEFNPYVYDLFNYLMSVDFDNLNKFIIEKEKELGLKKSVKKENLRDDKNYIQNFYAARKYINHNKLYRYAKWRYFITFYCFSTTLSFNSSGKINSSVGNLGYNPLHVEYVLKTSQYYGKNIETFNKSFEDLLTDDFINSLTQDDYVYLDPPYYGTEAVYNKTWTMKQENLLLSIIDKLIKLNIKFGLSNIYRNKTHINQHLIDWVEKRGLTVYYPHIIYNYAGKGDNESVEVFITNLELNKQTSIFDMGV